MHYWWECNLVQPLWKAVWRFLKKLKIELPYDPVITFLSIYPKDTKTQIQKDIYTLIFIAALFIRAKIWKQPKGPKIDKWIKKWYMYTMEYYSATEDNEIFPFAMTWTEIESIKLSKINHSKKKSYDFTHMWNLRKKQMRECKTTREREANPKTST